MSDAGNDAQLDVIADRLFDTWARRHQGKVASDLAELRAKVARLEAEGERAQEIRITRDREIREIKDTVEKVDGKVDTLVNDKAGRDTVIGFAKWLVGVGFFGTVGSVILATLHYIGWLRPPA